MKNLWFFYKLTEEEAGGRIVASLYKAKAFGAVVFFGKNAIFTCGLSADLIATN